MNDEKSIKHGFVLRSVFFEIRTFFNIKEEPIPSCVNHEKDETFPIWELWLKRE